MHLFIYIFIIIWSWQENIIIIKRKVPSIKLWTLPRSNKFTNNHHKTLYVYMYYMICQALTSHYFPKIQILLVFKIIKLALCNYRTKVLHFFGCVLFHFLLKLLQMISFSISPNTHSHTHLHIYWSIKHINKFYSHGFAFYMFLFFL